MDASTDPTPDLGNSSGGIDVTIPHFSHATTHPFASESFDACIFVGGDSPHPFVAPVAQRCNLVVAADSGWVNAQSVGITPHILVGDFDSISAAELEAAKASTAQLIEYPSEKDFTDAELAIEQVLHSSSTSLLFISGGGDRLDHILSLTHALADIRLHTTKVCAIVGDTRIDFVTSDQPLTTTGEFGQIVSVLPIGGDVSGVTSTGLRWALHNDILSATSSRGVSNVITEAQFSVSVSTGTLLVMQPHYFPHLQEIPK